MGLKKAFPLRLDPELYEAIRRWADEELRSVNGQIEFLLRDAVEKAGKKAGPLKREKKKGR
ncbi:MAG: toxin-antitoxin system HicB family antitoxin [Candidatus Eisenbacteria bacterium]|nr:toxin-antitoxin system HicB family antitoxin [Candidatus Eisenbacteria bacterium]